MSSTKTYKIQICDGVDGCGHIIRDTYTCPQRCEWRKHEHQSKYRGKVNNAPLMRKLVAREVEPK